MYNPPLATDLHLEQVKCLAVEGIDYVCYISQLLLKINKQTNKQAV